MLKKCRVETSKATSKFYLFDTQEYAKFSISEIIGGRMLDKEKLLTELEGTKQQLKEKEVIRRLGKTRCDGYIDILIALFLILELLENHI